MFAQARYYMPEVGRFVSEDPYKGNALLPQSINPYLYCRNNSFKYIDPSGLMPESPNPTTKAAETANGGCSIGSNPSSAGKGIIRQYLIPDPNNPGRRVSHFTIEVQDGEKSYITEQLGVPGSTVSVVNKDTLRSRGTTPSAMFEFEVPDASTSIEYQKRLVEESEERRRKNLPSPMYDLETKSCLTHCFDVLREGGVRDAPTTSNPMDRNIYKYMKKHEVK